MRARLRGALLAAWLLALPALAAPAAANGAPAPSDPVAALDAARAAGALGRWEEAGARLGNASAGLLARPAPAEAPGRDLRDHLDAARDAAGAADAPAFARAVALARASAVHGALHRARAALAQGAADLDLLPELLDVHRAGPELGMTWERVPQEPANATLRDRALQRALDRVSEAARVEIALAGIAVDARLADEARAHGAAGEALARALAPEAATLPAALREGWDLALADWPAAVAALDGPAERNASDALRTVLLGLGLGRTLVLLDSHADAVLVTALAAEKALRDARAAPTLNASLLADAAARTLTAAYEAHRRAIFLGGEGDIAPLDAAVRTLRTDLDEGGSLAAVRADVERIRGDLQRIAHLTFGSFAKVEFVHIPRNHTRNFTLVAGRFPFAGVASWEASLRWDPAVAQAVEVSSGLFDLEVAGDNTNGTLGLRGARTPPAERDAVLANLVFRGLGTPGAGANVSFDAFRMVGGDGREVEVFLLRPGNVSIALFDPDVVANATDDDADATAPTNPAFRERTPTPALAAVLALAAAPAMRRRRIGP